MYLCRPCTSVRVRDVRGGACGAHLALELALVEPDRDAVAGLDGGRVAYHARSIVTPAHGISSAEHGKRTQRVEPARGVLNARPGAVGAPCRGSSEAHLGRHHAPAN